MRHALGFGLASAIALAALPFAARFGPLGSAASTLAIGVVLALAASGRLSEIAAAGGALGALAAGALASSPIAAGAALLGLAYFERSTRVRGKNARFVHVALAAFGGAVALLVVDRFAAATLSIRAVSILVGATIMASPLFVEADDPTAHRFASAAEDVGEPARAALLRAASLRRAAIDETFNKRTAREVDATFAALARLAEARRVSEGADSAARRKLDDRIVAHVAAIARAFAAARDASAAEASLDDSALRAATNVGERLEHVSEALVDES